MARWLDAAVNSFMFESGPPLARRLRQFRRLHGPFSVSGRQADFRRPELRGADARSGGAPFRCRPDLRPAGDARNVRRLAEAGPGVVTFQDRYGAEVGRRGILHDDRSRSTNCRTI